MRRFLALIAAAAALAVHAGAQSCPAGQTTTISGTIYAPNGKDPLPNVLVYIPSTAPGPLAPGISCPAPGQLPQGAPILGGALTATDGTFTIAVDTSNPAFASLANVPLVAQVGKWRRQTTVNLTSCADTAVDPTTTRMPRNQSEGDIPLIAIATGSSDQVECVLRKVGIDDAEFTNPGGGGRINLFKASNSPGAQINAATPSASTLMADQPTLNNYDVLMLPCEGNAYTKAQVQLADLIAYANAGGRVYASHFSYDWMYQNGAFANVARWSGNSTTLSDGTATIDITFAGGQSLADWLQLVGATTTKGQVALSTLKKDQTGVIAPTQSWMTLNSSGSPVMQFTFDTPVGAVNQCGRVLFDEYHVENPPTSPTGKNFPAECSSAAITPQEKLMEFTLFDLTGSGGLPTMAPATAAFGNEAIHFTSAAQSFKWTNNSIFPVSVTSAIASGDFSVASNNCGVSVNAGASCTINVVYAPTALGAETGTLSVVSTASTLTAALTGTGVPDLTSSASSTLTFGNIDVGATSPAQTITLSNTAGNTVVLPALTITGDFAVTGTTCSASLAAGANCSFTIVFKPTATGARTGVFSAGTGDPAFSGLQTALNGTGVDFSISLAPTSGSVIAGLGVTPLLTLTPISGFSGNLTQMCTSTVSGSTCTVGGGGGVALTAITTEPVAITTIAQYSVIGYSGMGGNGFGLLGLLATGSALLLWRRRKAASHLLRVGLLAVLLTVGLCLGGCSGHLPAVNPVYTPPGAYTYTVTASDGTITHTATYSLNVTIR